MKKTILLLAVLFLLSYSSNAQIDSLKKDFLYLVEKCMNDKKLTGTFQFKGYKVLIHESYEQKTTIGKFIKVKWYYLQENTSYDEGNCFEAIFHNKLGYMTRTLFQSYAIAFKDYKVSKNSYQVVNRCYELNKDLKLPVILVYNNYNEFREIE